MLSYWLLAASYWLLAFSYWLLAIGNSLNILEPFGGWFHLRRIYPCRLRPAFIIQSAELML